jgi:ADP-heptose:LPS heptosyltransferase
MTLAEKRWPARHFGELARRVLAGGSAVIVLGGPTDADPVADLVASAPGAADLSAQAAGGADSLGRAAALLEAADLFVGNDTGIAHLATAVGTPAVVVFGPTDHRRYGPLPGSGVAVTPAGAVAAPAAGRLAEARGSRRIEAVPVDSVWAAVIEVRGHSH